MGEGLRLRINFAKTNNIFYNAAEMRFDGRANPLNNILPMVPELYEVLFAPQVRGALTSILGNDYVLHTHRYCHTNFPAEPLENGQGLTMSLHKDGRPCGRKATEALHTPLGDSFLLPTRLPDRAGANLLMRRGIKSKTGKLSAN